MNRDDPLEDWLFLSNLREEIHPEVATRRLADIRARLDRLASFLDNPPKKQRTMYDVCVLASDVMPVPSGELARAQELYRRVYETGGTGSTYVQERVLALIAVTADPVSIPFWLETCNLSRPRDTFAGRRRAMALAALTLLAIRRNVPESYAALREVARHPKSDVRALAVHYLGRAYLDAERPLPEDVQAELWSIATEDGDFEPRFQARAVLWDADLPAPMDNPDGVYALKTTFRGSEKSVYRTIELRSNQTLLDLHYAIQRAFRWDADHLYSFYMNGQKHDERYAFACPHEEDCLRWVDEVSLGQLGLSPKLKFLYHFDYGDDNLFDVQVVAIYPQAKAVDYPRVVESRGPAPKQYGRW